MDEDILLEEDAEDQALEQPKGRAEHLRAWQFQPGKSGNPGGRPPGVKSLKQFAKEYLLSLSDDEKLEYMKGMDKKIIWEMAEDKAGQGVNVTGEITSKVISVDE